MTATGWRLVPVEATKEMLHHGCTFDSLYRDMLAAAPDPLQDERLIEMVAVEIYAKASGYIIQDAKARWSTKCRHARKWYCDQASAVIALFRGERA